MIWIEKLEIENFQSHQNTVISFSKGLNVITGPSDQGKTAILRALKWVLYNEPRGTEFIRHGTDHAKVTLKLSSGISIIRERSKSRNRYTVVNANGDNLIFEGFGNEVPEEVKKAHRMPKVFIDEDRSTSLNISEQLEGAFLLSVSGSARAKAIGRLTGVHIIDIAVRKCLIDIRRESQLKEKLTADIDELGRQLEGYNKLDKIKIRLKDAGVLIDKLGEDIKKLKSLEKTKHLYVFNKQCLKKAAGIHERMQMLDRYEELYRALHEKAAQLHILQKLNKALKEAQSGLVKSKIIMRKMVKAFECKPAVEAAGQLIGILKNLSRYHFNLIQLDNEIESSKELYEGNKAKIIMLIEKYSRILLLTGKCPVCSSEINIGVVKRIIHDYKESCNV